MKEIVELSVSSMAGSLTLQFTSLWLELVDIPIKNNSYKTASDAYNSLKRESAFH